MKTLIIYASKRGCTEDCARELAIKLKKNVTVMNINQKKDINLKSFDLIILGTPIYIGKINSDIKSYCYKNERLLLNKKVAFFACGSTSKEQICDNLNSQLPKSLKEQSIVTSSFGGELRYDRMNALLRYIVRKIQQNKQIEINHFAIEEFSTQLKRKLKL